MCLTDVSNECVAKQVKVAEEKLTSSSKVKGSDVAGRFLANSEGFVVTTKVSL